MTDLDPPVEWIHQVALLEQVGEEPGEALVYRTGDTTLCVYRSQFAGTNKGTSLLWEVPNVEKVVKQLKARGVRFEHYDEISDLTRDGDVHRAGAMVVAWFKDPDGNILSIQNTANGMAGD